jgi:hypothetical protein
MKYLNTPQMLVTRTFPVFLLMRRLNFILCQVETQVASSKLIDIRRWHSSAICRYLVGQKFNDVSELCTPSSGPNSRLKYQQETCGVLLKQFINTLRYVSVQSGRQSLVFRRDIMPPSSWAKCKSRQLSVKTSRLALQLRRWGTYQTKRHHDRPIDK